NAIGERVDANTAAAMITNLLDSMAIDERTARLMLSAAGNGALRPAVASERDAVRASIIKQMLINIV
ncbi:MAG: hypothetical protein LBC21_01075, partial [Oscillospiraceae bacterium]|nr:hypothetical protein [Oscillospiraceae bacterium]